MCFFTPILSPLIQVSFSPNSLTFSIFSHEVEKKKEDLRQMVGRRYRDVLLAANAVRRLTEISGDILQQVQTMKTSTISVIELHHQKGSAVPTNKKLTSQHFILLNSLIPMVCFIFVGFLKHFGV